MRGQWKVKPVLGLFLFLLMQQNLTAQRLPSISIESETIQVFAVELGERSYASDKYGYLFLPDVAPGRQTLLLSLEGSEKFFVFEVMMGEEPQGYSLRLGIDGHWNLFDMVRQSMVTGILQEAKAVVVTPPLQVWVAKKEADTLLQFTAAEIQVKTALPKTPLLKTLVRKTFEKTGADGVDQVYVLQTGAQMDTVILFVPVLSLPRQEPIAQMHGFKRACPSNTTIPMHGSVRELQKQHAKID